jgi:hypothetical protein
MLVACTASCAVEEIVAATSERHLDDGGHHPHPCTNNDECHPEEFCAKVTCEDAEGACVRRPIVCGATPEPSCGCDGITYLNDCLRRTKGIAAATPDECDATAVACGGPAKTACPDGSYCAQLLSAGPVPVCPADAPGTCWVLPTDCGPPAPGDRWMPCGPPAPCVDTCTAIRASIPHWRAPAGAPECP